MNGAKTLMGFKKNTSKSSYETKTHVQGISKGSFEYIMGWGQNLQQIMKFSNFLIFTECGNKNFGLSEYHEISNTLHTKVLSIL